MDSSCFVAAGLVVDLATWLPVEVVMISQESTTKDVKVFGYEKIKLFNPFTCNLSPKHFKILYFDVKF